MIFKIILSVFIMGLFLYSKLLPYKDRLNSNYKVVFDFFDAIFEPLFKLMKKAIKPFQVGTGLSVDMTQIVFLVVLLVIFNLM